MGAWDSSVWGGCAADTQLGKEMAGCEEVGAYLLFLKHFEKAKQKRTTPPPKTKKNSMLAGRIDCDIVSDDTDETEHVLSVHCRPPDHPLLRSSHI